MVGYKQAIVLRRDIVMGRGKAAAQAAHASCMAVFNIIDSKNEEWGEWLKMWRIEGQKKIVLRAENLGELEELYENALRLGLPASIVVDAGHTQLPPGTKTAIAVGPGPEELVDRITGRLKLY